MSLILAGRLIQSPGALSELSRLVLACIDGGVQWLQWAITNPLARYEFPDESLLVAGVQQGLHGSPLLLIPRLELLVSPLKLMTLGTNDLRVLAKAEGGDTSTVIAVQIKKVLIDHGLLVRADLAAAQAFLTEVAVATAPVFQAMDFADHLAVHELLQQSQSSTAQSHELQLEAARFALQQSRTTAEFGDYYQSYLDYIAKASTLESTPEQRMRQADAALQTLLPLLFGALDCPQIAVPAAPSEVSQAVRAWATRGRQVGFARLSHGVLQIIRHTPFGNEGTDAARVLIERYLAAAQSFVVSAQAQAARMGQDGVTCLFTLQAGNQQAQLQLGVGGVIALRSFEKLSPPPTPTHSDPSNAGNAA